MKKLNDSYKNWFEKAEGFLEAYTLIFNEWDWTLRRGFPDAKLIQPQAFLFQHTAELYLKTFLSLREKSGAELRKFSHKLNDLRVECAKCDEEFFNTENMKYLDMCAGSSKNYADKKYPEGTSSACLGDLVLLRQLQSFVKFKILEKEGKLNKD